MPPIYCTTTRYITLPLYCITLYHIPGHCIALHCMTLTYKHALLTCTLLTYLWRVDNDSWNPKTNVEVHTSARTELHIITMCFIELSCRGGICIHFGSQERALDPPIEGGLTQGCYSVLLRFVWICRCFKASALAVGKVHNPLPIFILDGLPLPLPIPTTDFRCRGVAKINYCEKLKNC